MLGHCQPSLNCVGWHLQGPDYLNVFKVTDMPQVAEAEAATLN